MKPRKLITSWLALTVLAGGLVCLRPALADEGMWTFDNPPLKLLQERYGFTPTREWLDHVRLSSVRFNDGGSGSFVSATGLVLTNHHVGVGQLQKLSTPEKDHVKNGFYARTHAEELTCPDLELNVLISMEDVTSRVTRAAAPGMSESNALKAQKAEIAQIEKESAEKTGLRAEVVSLYQGGEYWLYRYKKYTDVRLAFAPEQQAAFFGGDPDNFTFPRHALDFAIFRVYENDRPVSSEHYLKWNGRGAADGELVFVSGHPGSTERKKTLAELEVARDYEYPSILKILTRRLELLRRFAAQGPEQARQANNQIFGIENAVKAFTGEYDGLRDKTLLAKKEKDEKEFRQRVAANPEWQKAYGSAWDDIARAEKRRAEMFNTIRYRSLRGSRLGLVALQVVRYATETKKPDAERLEEYHDSQLESLKFRLFSPAPFFPAMEEMLLANTLQESLDELGADDPFVKAALGGRSPAQLAKEMVAGTKLTDAAVRKSLAEGGEAAVAASNDPLIQFARRIDPHFRQMRKWLQDNIESVETPAGEKIGRARFAVYGKSAYPDATFTLRLTYGTVRGFPMNGTNAPSKTTLYGLYDRAISFDMKPPYDMTERFVKGKEKLDLSTPLNFVTTCDVVGGNSGSPVLNRAGELVGLIFDGNIQSLVGNFVYVEENNRSVAVHPAAILETMRKLYHAGGLADELEGKAAKAAGAN
jgi:hypothetical protein